MKITTSSTSSGTNIARIGKPYEILGNFLTFSIQSSPELCAIVLSHIQQVVDGEKEFWQSGFNLHSLDISAENVYIRNSHNDESCEVPIDEFIGALTQWCTFICDRNSC